MSDETVIKGSRAKGGVLLVASAGFTAVSVWLLTATDSNPLFGWAGLILFGLGALVSLAIIVRPNEVRLRSDRFTVTTLWKSFDVAWDDVERFHVWRNPAAAQTLAAWTYKPGRRPTGALAEASANLGAEGAMPGMLSLSTPRLVDLLNRELEARRA